MSSSGPTLAPPKADSVDSGTQFEAGASASGVLLCATQSA
jgi:hypothetical protein